MTIDKARLFLGQARRADPTDRATIAANLEAAIVFARSVTFHLQSQFADHAAFEAWYSEQQSFLRGHRLSRFLLEQRNYALKVGPVEVSRMIGIAVTEMAFARDEVSVQVVRGQPWWRRSPKILIEDALYPWRQRFRLWKERREWKRDIEKRRAHEATSVAATDNVHFSGTEWQDTPALELVETHLDVLSRIVADAEARFVATRRAEGSA